MKLNDASALVLIVIFVVGLALSAHQLNERALEKRDAREERRERLQEDYE